MNHPRKCIAVLFLTALLTAAAGLMIGPQILIIVPMAILAGVVFAIRRSFLSLVCFGYPFTFGVASALIGYAENPGYERTTAFAVFVAIGMAGIALMAAGLWKAVPGRSQRKISRVVK